MYNKVQSSEDKFSKLQIETETIRGDCIVFILLCNISYWSCYLAPRLWDHWCPRGVRKYHYFIIPQL